MWTWQQQFQQGAFQLNQGSLRLPGPWSLLRCSNTKKKIQNIYPKKPSMNCWTHKIFILSLQRHKYFSWYIWVCRAVQQRRGNSLFSLCCQVQVRSSNSIKSPSGQPKNYWLQNCGVKIIICMEIFNKWSLINYSLEFECVGCNLLRKPGSSHATAGAWSSVSS